MVLKRASSVKIQNRKSKIEIENIKKNSKIFSKNLIKLLLALFLIISDIFRKTSTEQIFKKLQKKFVRNSYSNVVLVTKISNF